MVDRYLIRPKDAMFENLCYALFIKRYQLQAKSIENALQPEELVDKLFEANHSIVNSYPDVLHYRRVELVLRYNVPNKFKDPEGYAHHLLFMFNPFRDKCELKVGQPSSCTSILSKPEVLQITNINKCLVDPYVI